MLWLVIQFILGIVVLNKAADWFARGAASVAELSGMPRLWMGAILGGFVSAIPEKLFSCFGAALGHSELAVGNVIGSVTFNSVLLGICLLQARGPIDKRWFRDHGIPMLVCLLILTAFGMSSSIGWPVGLLFICLCAFYVMWSVFTAKRQPEMARQAEEIAAETLGQGNIQQRRWAASLLLVIGIPLLLLSSYWLYRVSVQMAQAFGITESVVGLTLVAVGTSLPELAACWAATRRGHLDTTIGLIFGESIFVGMGATGISALFGRLTITPANQLFDLPVMLILRMLPFLPLLWGRTPGRVTGYILLVGYAVYIYALFALYGVFQI